MLTYKELGSDADKDAIHLATKSLDKGLFPGAFCFIAPDNADDPDSCFLKHTDGAGSKANIAYIATQEGASMDVWKGIAHDSLIMNIDDMAAVGAVGRFQLTNCIDRNPFVISDDAIAHIIQGYIESIERLSPFVQIDMCGGETADTGNNVRSIVVNADASTRMKRADVIDASQTQVGDVLIGCASYGQTTYETQENSGISSNGFTLLTHALLDHSYRDKYPETFDPRIGDKAYSGKFTLQTPIPNSSLTLGQSMLSPTRSFVPLIKKILTQKNHTIHGIFNCTGGGLSKPIRFGTDVRYTMDNMLDPGPFFRFVYAETTVSPKELYKTFNMGCRLIIACGEEDVGSIVQEAKQLGIYAQKIGSVEKSATPGMNEVIVTDPIGKSKLSYEKQIH